MVVQNNNNNIFGFVSRYHFPIVVFDNSSSKEEVVGTCTLLKIGERIIFNNSSACYE